MTPQRTKELIQGGTVSVIKSLQRIDFKLGEWNIGGTIRYISMGGFLQDLFHNTAVQIQILE